MQTPTTETTVEKAAEGRITFADYLRLYDGQRAEWIAGKVEVHVSNNTLHNRLLWLVLRLFGYFLDLKPVGEILLEGVPMYLGDDKPARQPDLMIMLNENRGRIQPTYLDGAADVVVEIVSPESGARDRGDKFYEYEAAGVREYWLIDPQRREADVYGLQTVIEGDAPVYRRLPLDAQGRLQSAVLPGFAFDASLLWADEPPSGMALLRLIGEMTDTRIVD